MATKRYGYNAKLADTYHDTHPGYATQEQYDAAMKQNEEDLRVARQNDDDARAARDAEATPKDITQTKPKNEAKAAAPISRLSMSGVGFLIGGSLWLLWQFLPGRKKARS